MMRIFIFVLLMNFFCIIQKNNINCIQIGLQSRFQEDNTEKDSVIDSSGGIDDSSSRVNFSKNNNDNSLIDIDNKLTTKSDEDTDELIKSLTNLGDGSLKGLNLKNLKIESDVDFSGQTCGEIKKMGQQKSYCENKFLLQEGEEKTVECLKSFCSICCDGDENCQSDCSKTHAFYSGHDPEEMFISVCSNKNMGPSFENFCNTMLMEKDPEEYRQCFTNFCFDCCSNELKINDFNDPEMIKCLNACRPEGLNKEIQKDFIKSPNKIMEKKSLGSKRIQKGKKHTKNNEKNGKIKKNQSIKDDDDLTQGESNLILNKEDKKENVKVLVDFSKPKRKIQNTAKTEQNETNYNKDNQTETKEGKEPDNLIKDNEILLESIIQENESQRDEVPNKLIDPKKEDPTFEINKLEKNIIKNNPKKSNLTIYENELGDEYKSISNTNKVNSNSTLKDEILQESSDQENEKIKKMLESYNKLDHNDNGNTISTLSYTPQERKKGNMVY
jgi:hypothetical protein